MSSRLERIREQIYKAGVAERLLKNEDFEEYQKMLDEEINYYTNRLIDEKTHPKDYLTLRAEVNARRSVRNTLKALIAKKGKLLKTQEQLEEIEDA